PQVPQVIGDHAQPQSHFVGPETMATQPCHLHRLLAFLDPLLRRAPLIIEPHHGPTVSLQVGDDEPHTWEQLSKVELHLGHHPPWHLPTRRLIQKALVLDQWLDTGPAYRPWQQLRDIPFQVFVGRYADGILYSALLQCFINLWLGEGGIGSKHHFLAQLLLPLNLGQQKFFPTLGTVHVSGPQLCSQTAALAIKSRLIRASPAKFSSSASISVSKVCNRDVSAAPRSQIFSEPMSRNVGSCDNRSASFISSYPARRLYT